jgi:hypothetical protein
MKNFRIIPKSVINFRWKGTMWFDYFFNISMVIIGLLSFMLGWGKLINPYVSSFLTFSTCIPAILYISGKFNPFVGLADYQTKRDGQIAVICGAFISSLGILQFTPAPYFLLEPSGSYGLAALFGVSFIFAGIYIIISTPILEQPPYIVEETLPEVVCHVSESTNVNRNQALERVWGKRTSSINSTLPPISTKPEIVKMSKIPLVHYASFIMPQGDLSSRDIIREVEIDSDWLAEGAEYVCVQINRSSIVGVNRANNKPFKMGISQKVLVLAGHELLSGTIRLNEGIISFNVNGKVQQIQASQILGSIDWILPA